MAPRATADGGRAMASSGGSTAQLTVSSQSIIYTAKLSVRVRDVDTAATAASGFASSAGGYTADEQARAGAPGGRRAQVSMTLKVPVPGYQATLAKLSRLGQRISLNQQSTDVTQQVADVASRVTSEQDAIAQLRTLLRRAGSVSGLLQVQEQLSSDESALEALLAQQRSLNHETSYATISLVLLSPRPHAAAGHTRRGFGAGLSAGWHGLRHATSWVLTALGVLLPFALVIAIIAGIGYLGWRQVARRRGTTPTQAS